MPGIVQISRVSKMCIQPIQDVLRTGGQHDSHEFLGDASPWLLMEFKWPQTEWLERGVMPGADLHLR